MSFNNFTSMQLNIGHVVLSNVNSNCNLPSLSSILFSKTYDEIWNTYILPIFQWLSCFNDNRDGTVWLIINFLEVLRLVNNNWVFTYFFSGVIDAWTISEEQLEDTWLNLVFTFWAVLRCLYNTRDRTRRNWSKISLKSSGFERFYPSRAFLQFETISLFIKCRLSHQLTN